MQEKIQLKKFLEDAVLEFLAKKGAKAELLIENGADVNAKSADQFTLLRCSFEKNNLEMSLILLKSVASLIDKDDIGNIAMELSLKSNAMEVLKTIVAFQH